MGIVESRIAEWRTHVTGVAGVGGDEIEELESRLRHQIAELEAAGLTVDEAFLIGLRRLGEIDGPSRAFALERGGSLWSQPVGSHDADSARPSSDWLEALVFAAGAAVVVQIARLAPGSPDGEPDWLVRNIGLYVLPFLAGYFARRGRFAARQWALLAVPFVLAALVVNLYPYPEGSGTGTLVAIHLPVVLWFVVAYPYMGGTLRSHERRLGFVWFTGECFIYYVLIALGGGVLMGLTAGVLEPTGIDIDRVAEWVIPSGSAAGVVVAAWLVESRQRVVGSIAPVLTMLFTPLFAVMLTAGAAVYAATALGEAFDREILTIFDALLLVVLGLLLFGMSASESSASRGWMDGARLVAVVGALVLDAMVLGSMIARIDDLGLSPNRTAALGLNLVLLVNLAGAALLAVRFLLGRTTRHRLERWQTAYFPVFALWAAAVVVVLPLAFGFE